MLGIRVLFLALCGLTVATAQTPSSALETSLQAILAEIHQLRQDLQATIITAQRVQILLYRIQVQQGATSRALTRTDEIHSKLVSAQDARARNAKDVEQLQECVNSATDPNKIKECQAVLTDRKRSLEIWQSDEQQWQGKDAEAQSQLRAEQAKLDQLQDTLDRLDKALSAIAKQ